MRVAGKEPADDDSGYGIQIQAERLRKLKLENDETEGRLVDAEWVQRLMARTSAMAKQILYQLVFDVPALLPSTLPEVVKEEIGRSVKQKLDGVCSYMASEYKSIDVNELIEDGV